MSEIQLKSTAAVWSRNVSSLVDRKTAIGVFIGLSVALGGYAVSATSDLASTTDSASSTLLSSESSIVADDIKAEAEKCATGTTEGTIGHSIGNALKIHTELASATPNVETLFDVSNDCFSGVSKLFDLSFSIPSMASILSAAQSAVMAYAQKKVCSAVKEVSGMVTSPINGAITKVNGLSAMTDLDGMTSGLVKQGMTALDPGLGSEYHAPGGGSTVVVDGFGKDATTFDPGTSSGDTGLSGSMAKINELNMKIANIQAQVGPAEMAYNEAASAYSSCSSFGGFGGFGGSGNCAARKVAMDNAKANLDGLNSSLANLKSQLAAVVATSTAATAAPTVAAAAPAPASTTSGTSSWWSSISSVLP